MTLPYKYNCCILLKGLPYMYVTINHNMYTICIRNTARSKSIPLMCTHIYSYMFSTVHLPSYALGSSSSPITEHRFISLMLMCVYCGDF